ncbi:cytochrome P450 [Streptomyces sp. NBC_01281]|uniref:cytochrome P450 n=1 Tax=unclassified Streptomyces TaxID=2593676 RepID=UPI0013B92CB0|nr:MULTISPECIES: cytochrome P450 [unclassified Streptomyces]MCX5135914.1 cytochrome P450 [Streptomyces sp. NBC_00340]NEB29076.1 cytochrome P450 [Streptomyces sp. SID14446]WSK60346.1 cytochrome P450 [Streptomyces sp. NBC_01281]
MPNKGIPADDLNRVDLTDPSTFLRTDMEDFWRRVRTEQPVYLHPATDRGSPFWVVSRHADVMAVLQDAERFSSQPGNMMSSLHKPGGDPAAGKILALTDAPRHNAMRTILLKAFSPRIRKGVTDKLQQRVDQILGHGVGTGTFDFAKEVAEVIPMGTICDLLGFPSTDHKYVLDLSREAVSADDEGQTEEDVWLSRNELLIYSQEIIETRREDPQDDLISAMATCRINGEPMTDDEVVVNCYGFILAGDHTSRLAMVGALLAFAQHPEQWRALKEGRVSIASAVEEIVRWTTPAMHIGRTATADVTIGGRTIREGEHVILWITSANRDESVFPDPHRFDLARTPNKHLGFGFGPHFCFGSYLGRAEIAAVLKTLVSRVDRIELTGDPKALYSTFLRGYSSLPVSLVAGPSTTE